MSPKVILWFHLSGPQQEVWGLSRGTVWGTCWYNWYGNVQPEDVYIHRCAVLGCETTVWTNRQRRNTCPGVSVTGNLGAVSLSVGFYVLGVPGSRTSTVTKVF